MTSLAQLERLAAAGKLRGLRGIQARTEQNILRGITLVRGGQARMPLGRALPLGRELGRALGDVRGAIWSSASRPRAADGWRRAA